MSGQVRRSSISVMANIAEGFHRHSNKDFIKFLSYSRASLAETVSHFYIAIDQKYIVESEMVDLKSKAEVVGRKINGLISYLNKKSATN